MEAVLVQGTQLIGIFSRKFLPTQTQYTVGEKEILAVIEALKYLRHIIYLSKVYVFTDHANLLHDTVLTNNRCQRWRLLLSEYDLEWTHVNGEDNTTADMLSRCFAIASTERKGKPSNNMNKPSTERKGKTSRRIRYRPKNEKEEREILENAHQKLVHCGIKTLERALTRHVYIDQLRRKLKQIRDNCGQCQHFMTNNIKYSHVKGGVSTTSPFKHISSDVYGPIDTWTFDEDREESKLYILTISDRCTRWTQCFPIFSLKGEELISALESWLLDNPKPETILTDNGRNYVSQTFNDFLKRKGIKHLLCTPYNPTGNSISERVNPTITRVL